MGGFGYMNPIKLTRSKISRFVKDKIKATSV